MLNALLRLLGTSFKGPSRSRASHSHRDGFAQHPRHRNASAASGNQTYPLFELGQILRCDTDFTSSADELEAEKLDAVRLGDATLLLVHHQLQFPRQKPLDRNEHAASAAVRLDVDLNVIGISCKPQAASRYTEGSRTMLKYLLENGADANVTYAPEGWIAIIMAANNGQEGNVRLLVKHGARLDSKDWLGQTSLEMARQRLAEFKDPNFNYPHGELSDPAVRQDAIDQWKRMVDLLTDLEDGT